MSCSKRERGECCAEADSIDHRIVEIYIRAAKYHRMLLERQLNRDGMFCGQHQILMCISRNPDASQRELAKFHNVSTAAVAVALKKLEKGGYIERLVDREDNRYNKIRLTEKGRQKVSSSIQLFEGTEREMLGGFSDMEKEELFGYLGRISKNLEQMLQRT